MANTILTEHQRKFAHHHLMFDRPLSPEVHEAIQRAALACYENAIKETGLTELFCGLYLQYKDELCSFFEGEILPLVNHVLPKHRFGDEGLVPEKMIRNATSEGNSCDSGVMYSIGFSDELLRVLWVASRLANAVGKKASLKDLIAAVTLEDEWLGELRRNGITLKANLADFRDVLNVVFHMTPHTHESWPRQMRFDLNQGFRPPFTLVVSTPSRGFQPVRTATVKINGDEVAAISWPSKPTVSVTVELQSSNGVEFALDGPQFGSMELTIRGTRA
jgi:hypothetical protein